MKSYEDMANEIFKRRDEYIKKKKKTRRAVMGAVTPLMCLCLVFVIGLGVYQKADVPSPSEQTEQSDTADESSDGEETDILDDESIRWADPLMYVEYLFGTGGQVVLHGTELLKEFDTMPDDQVIMVCMGISVDRDKLEDLYGHIFDPYYNWTQEQFVKYGDTRSLYGDIALITVTRLLEDKGMNYDEIARSEDIIDYFLSLYEGEYGLLYFNQLYSNSEGEEIIAKSMRARLEELGFEVLYDETDDDWGPFFVEVGHNLRCVVKTTPKQIRELEQIVKETGEVVDLLLAPEDPLVAHKHLLFDKALRNVPSGYWKQYTGTYIEGYNGNVDEFYQMVLEERKANKQEDS